MPLSKTAKYQNRRDASVNAPKETKKMRDTMDAVDENLDKLSYALKDRFRKLVSSQISLLKYNMPNLQPINVKVSIKHREVRICSPNAESPDVDGEDTFNEEHPETVNEESVSKSEEVTTVHIKQKYQGEIKYNESPSKSRTENPSSGAPDDDKLVKRTYQKVTYRKKLMKSTGMDSPEGLRNISNEGAENTSPFNSPRRSTEHELHGTRSRRPVVTKERIEGPVIIRNFNRSPASSRGDVKSSVSAKTVIRSPNSKMTRIVSPLSRRKDTESPSKKNARSPLSTHRNVDPLPLRDRNGCPMQRRNSPDIFLTTRSSPKTTFSKTIDYNPIHKSLEAGNSILAKHLVRSPVSVRYNTQYLLPSRSAASSPTRSGKSSPLNSRATSRSPVSPRNNTKYLLSSRSPTRSGKSSYLKSRATTRSPVSPRNNTEYLLSSRSPNRSGRSSPLNSSTATRSPVSQRKIATSPISARGSRSPLISETNAGIPLTSAERSPLSMRGAIKSPTLSRKEVHSAIYMRKCVDNRIVPRDERSDQKSQFSPSTTVSTRRLTTDREINEVFVAGRQMSAIVRHKMPSPVDKKLQTVVNRLESYNQRVSPRMEKIKKILSHEKVINERHSPPLTKLPRDEGVATTESAKLYKCFEQTKEKKSSRGVTDTKFTRTEMSEQRAFITSPRPLSNESTNRASCLLNSENVQHLHLNKNVEKAFALSKNECPIIPAPIPEKGHVKEKQSEHVSKRSPGVSNESRRFNRQKEFQQLTSPVSDDLTIKGIDVCRKLSFDSPTDLPTVTSVLHEKKKGRNTDFGSVSFNDTLNSYEVAKYKDNTSTPVTGYSKSFLSETSSHSDGVSTLLIDSLDEMDQYPLAHSTPIAEDSTVRYLPISQSSQHSYNSLKSSLDKGGENYCVSCYEKEMKRTYLLERGKKHPEKHKGDKGAVQISNKREMEKEYTKSDRKDMNKLLNLNSYDPASFVDREDKFVKNGVDDSISKGSVGSKQSCNSDRNIAGRSTSKVKSSVARKRTQKEIYVNDCPQNIKKVARETKEIKRCEKNNETSMSEEHRIVKQLECNGEEKEMQQIKRSNYTSIIQDDHGKQTFPEKTHADPMYKNHSQPNAFIEKKTLKQLKRTVVQATQGNEKATQTNMTLEEHLVLKALEYEKNENDWDNEKMTQVNMTKEEQEILRELKPCIITEELDTEQAKERNDKSKVKKESRKEYLEIQTKSTVGSQTEIIEDLKSYTTHEESSQTDVYVQPETAKQMGNTDQIFFDSEKDKTHQETVTCCGNKEMCNEKKIDIETLQRAYEDIQSRLHVSATAALVSAAKDALKKSINDDFHRELWIALNDNVHRLQEDFGRFLSTYIEPKDTSCCQANVNEWEYKVRNRIETLLSLCNDLDRNEFREHMEQLICRLRSACFEQGAQSRSVQYIDEMKTLFSGLTNLTENFAVCGERFLGKTGDDQRDIRMPESDTFQELPVSGSRPSVFITTANETAKTLLECYSGRTRPDPNLSGMPRQTTLNDVGRTPTTLRRHLDSFMHRHMFAFLLIFGVFLGTAIAYYGAPVARSVYKLVLACVMYIGCSLRLVHTNPPVV